MRAVCLIVSLFLKEIMMQIIPHQVGNPPNKKSVEFSILGLTPPPPTAKSVENF